MIFAKLSDVDTREVKSFLGDFAGQTKTIIARALNKALKNTKTFTVKIIRETYMIKASRIKQNLKSKKASKNGLNAVLDATGKRISLISFGARQVKKGVSYKIRKEGGRELIPGAYIAPGKGGKGTFIYQRLKQYRMGRKKTPLSKPLSWPKRYRYPIVAVNKGPSVPTMMEGNFDRIEDYAERRKLFNINNEIDRFLARYK